MNLRKLTELEEREREIGNEQKVLKGGRRITKAESASNGNSVRRERKTVRGKLGMVRKKKKNEQGR